MTQRPPISGTFSYTPEGIVIYREQRCDDCDGSGWRNSPSGYAQRECQACDGAGFTLVEVEDD